MKFSLFFISEYSNIVTSSALMAVLFLGGWDIPFTGWDNAAPFTVLKTLLTLGCFLTKTGFFIFTFIWIRWTVPRFRYDQLMSLGWRVMLPAALGYVVVIASALLGLQAIGINPGPMHSFVLLLLNICILLVFFVMVDEGRVISPAYGRAQQARITKLRARSSTQPPVTEGVGR